MSKKYLIALFLIITSIVTFGYFKKVNAIGEGINNDNWLSREIALQQNKTLETLTQEDYSSVTIINKSSNDIYTIPSTISYCTNLNTQYCGKVAPTGRCGEELPLF